MWLLMLCVVATVHAAPYVLYDESNKQHDGSGGFSLCLGAEPSEKLRTSLLMCRELSYPFCVNSSLVGSVLRVDGDTARHFVQSLSEPTEHNIERLAWLVDSALVLLYNTFTARTNANLNCAHEWRSWVCSRAFGRTFEGLNKVPFPLCSETCERAEDACNAQLQCPADYQHPADQCTDFFKDNDRTCHAAASSLAGKTQSVPVFRQHDDYTSISAATPSHSTPSLLFFTLVAASYVARFACR